MLSCQGTPTSTTRVPIIKPNPDEPKTLKDSASKVDPPKESIPSTPELKKLTPAKKQTPTAQPEVVIQPKPSPAGERVEVPEHEPTSLGHREVGSPALGTDVAPNVGTTRSNQVALSSSVKSLPDLTKVALCPSDVTGQRRLIRKIIF